ncbi:lysine-rich arabinogalactan protein 19-like [Argentina anserina]|uniref:lysine-rich arabinogalactan protein 19-like n=1 Tax=Argentina anserina TaxID=57926 RepID=UPI0021768C2C|nr:lysine-rich arabinogalactan protein 19-like [Potentilla anserina]
MILLPPSLKAQPVGNVSKPQALRFGDISKPVHHCNIISRNTRLVPAPSPAISSAHPISRRAPPRGIASSPVSDLIERRRPLSPPPLPFVSAAASFPPATSLSSTRATASSPPPLHQRRRIKLLHSPLKSPLPSSGSRSDPPGPTQLRPDPDSTRPRRTGPDPAQNW